MKLYEVSPGYFYDDTHKRWSLFKMNDGQWRLEDLAPDSHSDHPTFAAAIAALKSHVGDVTVHRKKARMEMKQAVLKLAQENPEFRKTLVAELKLAREGTPPAVTKAALDFEKGMLHAQRAGKTLARLLKKHPVDPKADDWGRGAVAEKELKTILSTFKKWDREHVLIWSAYADSPMDRLGHDKEADRWENKPKGWTDESRKKFWDSLTSAAPKHKVTECIKRMNKHMGGNAGAFCASLADRVMPGWRQEAAKDRKKKGSSLTQPLSLRRDYGTVGSDEDEWLDVEEVREHCPPCADKMARNNMRKIKASVLRTAMLREATTPYRTINDAVEVTGDRGYGKGNTEIWYARYKGMGRDLRLDMMMGSKYLEKNGHPLPTDHTLSDTHALIGKINVTHPSSIFGMMQGENWSPSGEGRNIISRSNTGHTSMSVGDIIKIGPKLLFVDTNGFRRL